MKVHEWIKDIFPKKMNDIPIKWRQIEQIPDRWDSKHHVSRNQQNV